MMQEEVMNARIESTDLGMLSHGIASFYLNLDYGGGGQGFGGHTLDGLVKDADGKFIRRVGSDYGMEAILRTLKVVGVDRWEDLPGKHVRVVATHNRVIRIGNILKDEWLDLKELFDEMESTSSVQPDQEEK